MGAHQPGDLVEPLLVLRPHLDLDILAHRRTALDHLDRGDDTGKALNRLAYTGKNGPAGNVPAIGVLQFDEDAGDFVLGLVPVRLQGDAAPAGDGKHGLDPRDLLDAFGHGPRQDIHVLDPEVAPRPHIGVPVLVLGFRKKDQALAESPVAGIDSHQGSETQHQGAQGMIEHPLHESGIPAPGPGQVVTVQDYLLLCFVIRRRRWRAIVQTSQRHPQHRGKQQRIKQ